jgi:hypothetical protein
MRTLPIFVVAMCLAGCATIREPDGYDAQLLKQDQNSCLANPKALPGCYVGVMGYLMWRFKQIDDLIRRKQ